MPAFCLVPLGCGDHRPEPAFVQCGAPISESARFKKSTGQTPPLARFYPPRSIMFTGTYTAIVTPFKNGKIDEAAFARLIKDQIKGGVDGIVPVGTTGESPTVNYEEHVHIIALAVRFAAGKIKVLAGSGANSTNE